MLTDDDRDSLCNRMSEAAAQLLYGGREQLFSADYLRFIDEFVHTLKDGNDA